MNETSIGSISPGKGGPFAGGMELKRFETIQVELKGSILWVTMCHGKANALGRKIMTELGQAIEWGAKSDEVRGILLRSALEKIYCAGLDLTEVSACTQGEDPARQFASFIDLLSQTCRSALECPKPIATCVKGHCLAGGLVLALCTDFLCLQQGTSMCRFCRREAKE